MEKKTFVTLMMTVIGGLLFSLGMCMCLLPEWGVFTEGAIVGAVGAVWLLITWNVYRKMSGKKAIRLNLKTLGKVLYGIVASLVFGLGLCMIMVFDMMLWGILVGIVGVVLLLFLIPMCFGLKDSTK